MGKRRLAVLFACFLTVLTSYSIRYGYGMLLPEMLPDLAISKTEAGAIYTAFFLAYTVSSPILGIFADRYDVRKMLTLFSAVLAASMFLMAYSASIIGAAVAFALAGIGSAVCWAPVIALARRWVSERRKGMTLALVDAGSSIGIAVSSALMPLIVAAADWHMGWVSLGGLACVLVVVNFSFVRDPNVTGAGSAEMGRRNSEPLKTIYGRLLKDGKFWLIGLAYLLTGFSILVPFTFLSLYAVEEMAVPYGAAARLVTVIGVSALVGKLIMGPLSDRFGRIREMMLCALIIAGGLLGMVYVRDYAALVLVTAFFGFGYGAVWSLYAASASDYFPKELSGSIVGLWTVYLGVGSIFSPVVAGWVADTTGTLIWSFVVAMVAALISFFLLVPVWRTSSVR